MPPHDFAQDLIAVDIGNSRIKLGRFGRVSGSRARAVVGDEPNGATLPEPTATLELPLASRTGEFDRQHLAAWCGENSSAGATWLVASVHRAAAEQLIAAARGLKTLATAERSFHLLTYHDVPLAIDVDLPERVGIDRLLGALAANHLRQRDRAAIVVDLGTAINIDLVTAAGAFAGGAILPGLSMSARALEEQTDALPHVAIERWHEPPEPLGKATVPAIESGLFWGTVGAVRQMVGLFSGGLKTPPDIFVSGGNAPLIVEQLKPAGLSSVTHVTHLVLGGIALLRVAAAAKN
jgi:type III pantothenate kinase